MKKFLPILLFLSVAILPACANPHASSSDTKPNDVILSVKTQKNIKTTTYIHQEKDFILEKSFSVYKTPDESKLLFNLPAASTINILEIQVQEDEKRNQETVWYEIEYKNQTGWIRTDFNPYKGGKWAILETLSLDGKTKTVRKISQKFLLEKHKEDVYLYAAPSFSAEIIRTIPARTQATADSTVMAVAMVEEEEIITDGSWSAKDHWVKVLLDEKEAWIFGSYLDTGRGGPKYTNIPENQIYNALGLSLI